ncbi:hypothetical protein HBI56_089260 [Parastagonospora nodorum]|nr:hypothetical protein HBH51_092340 [Parastagonospora nodorum]KAH3999745.1 hypothetical protein HBI10_113180 [Parastagonospora nodorum]KAH4014691.1 hypothetical protein HBI13_169510 [Parastagonospora nodorum]KAH4035117.1 hypothetical protein HBI09_095630 [Parastagonospora nodorum]KAH4116040.1 hypothetical protein HBH47_174790 [Parastagonospora nodorum]
MQFVVTPWRDSKELLQVRHDLYGTDSIKKERAVNKVFAWRSRKPDGLPLLLDSTADIVDVLLQDQRSELKHNPSRLLYATAVSRFITGLADTQIDLIRDKPAWFPPGKSLQLPYPLLEIRHRIVHRHLPSLAELKRAAQDSLDWLWEWYWSQLDYAFGVAKTAEADDETEGIDAVKEKLQTILKIYVKERKNEIKTRKKDSKAAENALSTYTLRYAPSSTSLPSSRIQNILLRLLVEEKMILPTDKKLGSSMSGAFLIWDPLLLAFCQSAVIPSSTLLAHFTAAMNKPLSAMISTDMDPVREGMHDWAVHILSSETWQQHLASNSVENTLTTCFSAPTYWNLRIAEALLKDEDVPNRESWVAILEAARNEASGEEMEVDVDGIEQAVPVRQGKPKEKIKGPTKVVGMWKARPIGWLPEGYEDDE